MSLIQHWPNDPRIPKCNQACHEAEAAASPAAPAVDRLIEEMAAAWPKWTFMFGHEVYDPIPGSPGETKHRELVGRMIWWAAARTHDDADHLVIKSAERQPSLGEAVRDLRRQLPSLQDTVDPVAT